MPGYFDNGSVALETGAHVFATPSEARRNITLDPHGRPAEVLDSGGGSFALALTGERLRANLGDAERWIYEVLAALATLEPGTLGLEDSQGNRATFAQAVCIGGAGEVQAFRVAELSMSWLAPQAATAPPWGAVPATPGTYAGTDTLLDYAAGGVTVGNHPAGMRIEMSRQYPLREVPRARGARSRGPARGAVVRFTVASHAVATGQHLAVYLRDLARSIGPRPVALTGNGNTFEGVVLETLRPRHADGRTTEFDSEFLAEL
jgi:hypothetical protein